MENVNEVGTSGMSMPGQGHGTRTSPHHGATQTETELSTGKGMALPAARLLEGRPQVTAYPPTRDQEEACLAEWRDYVEGREPILTTTPENPATARRPPARNLEERGLTKPGTPRATQAASIEKPRGSDPNGRQVRLGKGRTVMQQHVDFFDRDGDGVISMWDTYVGFRRLGFNIPFSIWAIFVVNTAFSLVSSPTWFPDPLLRIYSRNIHRGKHGSDQEVYDHEGRFIPQRFEDIFSKWDHEGKGGLSFRDLWEMTQSTFEVNDFFGWFAGKFEWFTLWLLTADHRGLVTKEAVRAVYDGSLFYVMEDKWSKGATNLGEYEHMGEGSTARALWNRLWGRPIAAGAPTTKAVKGAGKPMGTIPEEATHAKSQ